MADEEFDFSHQNRWFTTGLPAQIDLILSGHHYLFSLKNQGNHDLEYLKHKNKNHIMRIKSKEEKIDADRVATPLIFSFTDFYWLSRAEI